MQWLVVTGAVLMGIGVAIAAGYKQSWTGFSELRYSKTETEEFRPSKTLWDWLQLFIVPGALAVIAVSFSLWQSTQEQIRADQRSRTDREIAADQQREEALQNYLDEMADLMIRYQLRQSKKNSELRILARTRTLSVLSNLDGKRKGTLVRFLYEARLIDRIDPIVDLRNGDLTGASLSEANLHRASLRGANLWKARLDHSDLGGGDLSDVDLNESCLANADLTSTNLQGAVFDDSFMFFATLDKATGQFVSMQRANLAGASLSSVKFVEWLFSDTIITDRTKFDGPPPDGTIKMLDPRNQLQNCL